MVYIEKIEPIKVMIRINPDTNKSNLKDQSIKKCSNYNIE